MGKAVKVLTALQTSDGNYQDSEILNCNKFARVIIVIRELNIDDGHYKILGSPSLTEDVWIEHTGETAITKNATTAELEVTKVMARIKVQVKDDDGNSPFAKFDAWICLKRK